MLRIVIVEDEEMILFGLVNTIDWRGMDCLVVGQAADGEQGLREILEKRPDLVISDICLPGMSGLDMIERARSEHEFRALLLTSYSEFEYARRAITLRVDGYLLKPLDENELRSHIEQLHGDVATMQQANRYSELLERGHMPTQLLEEDLGGDRRYVNVALAKIMESSREHLSIRDIADELGISASYLSRCFKEITGRTFLDALNSQRVWQAAQLLKQGVRIAEVAERTGFSDYKHFSTVFKRYTGFSPRDFAKNKNE